MSVSPNASAFQILIVDDDKVVSLLHKNHIRHFNASCSPVSCYNGKEALEYLLEKDKKGNNYLIFLDLNMPVVNGWEFLEQLEKQLLQSNIYIIIVTSSINAKDEARALKFKNVISFCKKPLTEDSIRSIISLEQIQKLCGLPLVSADFTQSDCPKHRLN